MSSQLNTSFTEHPEHVISLPGETSLRRRSVIVRQRGHAIWKVLSRILIGQYSAQQSRWIGIHIPQVTMSRTTWSVCLKGGSKINVVCWTYAAGVGV
jgi:hypothetical protein